MEKKKRALVEGRRTVYTQKMFIKDLFIIVDDYKTNGKNSEFTSKDFLQAIELLSKTFCKDWEFSKVQNDDTIFFDFTTDDNGLKNGGNVEVDGMMFKLVK